MNNVSIIIPCYKQAHWLPDAIESALNQTVKCDIIVVNDGSPDNTSEVAKQYPVTLIEKENGGLSSARNEGIKQAKTKWILTLDADDKIAPDFIEKCLQVDADIIGTGQQEFGDSNNLSFFKKRPTHEDFKQNNQINCCSLFKREIWEKIGGYDETMKRGLEDWQFWLRATLFGYSVETVEEPLFFYRKHGESMISGVHRNYKEIHSELMDKFYEFEKNMHKM